MSNPKDQACARYIGPDCKYLTDAISYWCINKACCRARGTSIPGIVDCPYYRLVNKPSPWCENLLLTGLMLFSVVITVTLAWSLL